jgi:hypothetical protein
MIIINDRHKFHPIKLILLYIGYTLPLKLSFFGFLKKIPHNCTISKNPRNYINIEFSKFHVFFSFSLIFQKIHIIVSIYTKSM